ncbi:MAG: hypothetical protein AUJ00_02965 [Gemmatimonadetes bacterium 13_1_40CM_3_70_6]|nr:MAG: hypothetical protein AUJ00_02965 [Gemmatimonadetes bacterium 13_1_40CM_3_70_6]
MPTSARHTNSCQKRCTRPPSAVNALHRPTPHAITPRRDLRSASAPSGRAATASTMMYAEASQPSCWSESAKSRFSGSNTAKTTLRSV